MKKHQKKKNVFKVDHVRSIKLKAKAKQYTGHLKQLKAVITEKVKSTNDQLSALEDVVRQAPKKEDEVTQINSGKREENLFQTAVQQYNKAKENEADALVKLESWTCK